MGQKLTISPIGLKLIKSYEGFRPSDKLLVSGQRVVGYGHRVDDKDSVTLTKASAERLLNDDLSLFENMINENVHAPLSQSQFDALCSLAFNIGPKAFLSSDVLHALNNGRPLDAANAFDVWCKSNIDGRTYIVDALVRRRTAEKALFLKPEGSQIPASRIDLPPEADNTKSLGNDSEALPVFTKNNIRGLVVDAPYDTTEPDAKGRRREDRLPGPLRYSERRDDHVSDSENEEDTTPLERAETLGSTSEPAVLELDENNVLPQSHLVPADETDLLSVAADETVQDATQDTTLPNSSIAEAAAEVVEQLDALFDDPGPSQKTPIKPTSKPIKQSDERVKKDPVIVQEVISTPKTTTRDTKALDQAASQNKTGQKTLANDVKGYTSGTLSKTGETSAPYARVANDLSTDNVKTEKTLPKRTKALDVSEKVRVEKESLPKDSSQKYIQRQNNRVDHMTSTDQGPYAVMMIFGLTLIGGFLMTILRGPENLLGESGPMIAALGFMIGVMIFTGALYYFLRAIFRGRRDSRLKL